MQLQLGYAGLTGGLKSSDCKVLISKGEGSCLQIASILIADRRPCWPVNCHGPACPLVASLRIQPSFAPHEVCSWACNESSDLITYQYRHVMKLLRGLVGACRMSQPMPSPSEISLWLAREVREKLPASTHVPPPVMLDGLS